MLFGGKIYNSLKAVMSFKLVAVISFLLFLGIFFAKPESWADILTGLPPALKALAALVLTGHNRREIAYLLALEDTALRQRVSQLRKRFTAAGIEMPAGMPGLSLDLAYGRIRDALLPALLRHGGILASHDPDGHLFVVRRSQMP